MTYLCKFDNKGYRTETLLSVDYSDEQKAEMLKDGYVEISEEEWAYYVGNMGMGDNGTGYIRKNGKPVSAPAIVPSVDEQINVLTVDYESARKELASAYIQCMLDGDVDTQAEIQVEINALKEQYVADMKKLEG